MNLYGDVPLILATDYEKNSLLPREATKNIYDQLKMDLLSAFNTLKATYPTQGRARINKWVACALLARVYLYTEDWNNANLYSNKLIESGQYSLNNSLENVFRDIQSNETIWQLIRDNSNTSDGATFIPPSTTIKPVYILLPSLLTAFGLSDKRKTAWVSKNSVSGIDYYFPYKYKSRTAAQPREYNVILRLAEQYLIRAEAKAHLNDFGGAIADLNLIRIRAGLPALQSLTKQQLLEAIMKERQLEFFCEMGHRWFDLKRTGMADSILSSVKGENWQKTDALFPIPQTELDRNPNLVQNPGY